jgi:hypothetical protein
MEKMTSLDFPEDDKARRKKEEETKGQEDSEEGLY